ncbi:MAG: hypothetical protein MI749_17210, partial [Desulfovibrionales bacterium]|nr:hypothetical protein [Desulfovibrionales bacterium]
MESIAGKLAEVVKPILESLNIFTSVDLLHGVFEANGIGLDALMDIITFKVDGSGHIRLANRGEGGDGQDLGWVRNDGEVIRPTQNELTAFLTSHTAFARAKELAEAIKNLFPANEGYPSAEEMEQRLRPFVSTTFLEYGRGFEDTKTLWSSANVTGPKPGVEVLSIGLLRPMDWDTAYVEFPTSLRVREAPDGYTGIWVTMLMRNGSTVQEHIFGFIRDSSDNDVTSGDWKWNGNSIPFEFGGDIRPEAVKRIAGSSGEASYTSGFTIHLENDISSKGIAAVYVLNDLFPGRMIGGQSVKCVKLTPNSLSATAPWEIVTSGSEGLSENVTDGNRYTKDFSEDEAQSFSPDALFIAVNSSDRQIMGWPGFVSHLPVPVAVVQEASAQFFASINVLGTTAVANALAGTLLGNNPAELAVDWTNPSDTKLRAVEAAAFFTGQTGPRFSLAPNP